MSEVTSGTSPPVGETDHRHLGSSRARLGLRLSAAAVLGLLTAVVLVLGFLAFRAASYGSYVQGWRQLLTLRALPVLLIPAVLVWVSVRLDGRAFWRGVTGWTATVLVGAAAGAGIADVVSGSPRAPWTGGLVGGAAGAILGISGMGLVVVRTLRGPS